MVQSDSEMTASKGMNQIAIMVGTNDRIISRISCCCNGDLKVAFMQFADKCASDKIINICCKSCTLLADK